MTDAGGSPEGAAVTTDDTTLRLRALEGISGPSTRAAVVGHAMGYLLR